MGSRQQGSCGTPASSELWPGGPVATHALHYIRRDWARCLFISNMLDLQ